ncbi:hypothetical protein RINTHH_12810 [Richelia intracellularis HH01]|uniref:Uncharacterized protein n=1 Tax=Richelia intracellularis HH01 TaxID=1165094 RepID=M1X5L1_9NOST|nr:hypothetical protein RINTHH_12810 [Richelia intracellularis HH01]
MLLPLRGGNNNPVNAPIAVPIKNPLIKTPEHLLDILALPP